MPELPELAVYRERLEEAFRGRTAARARAHDPFVLRTVEPPLDAVIGRAFTAAGRRSKFLTLAFDRVLLAFHLMLGGRLHLKRAESFRPHRKRTVFSLELDDGTLLEMTEAGSRRKASLHVLTREADLARIERGTEPLSEDLTVDRLGALLRERNRRLKNALRDPDLVSGIGNAYSDEILFHARLSPLRLTRSLAEEDVVRLHAAIRETLEMWTERVRGACPEGLPVRQGDWRGGMAVHGKAGEPCPRCGTPVGRISFRDSETCYCPVCQNEGRRLADRRRSRLGIPPRAS